MHVSHMLNGMYNSEYVAKWQHPESAVKFCVDKECKRLQKSKGV